MKKKTYTPNVTQQELANKLGVSQMTISRSLKGRPGVSEKLCKRILSAAKKYGYVPDRIASGLRSKTTEVIGLIIPDVSNSFFPEITQSIEERANREGYNIILAHSYESYEKECKEVNILRGLRVSGFIIAPSGNQQDLDLYEMLLQQRIPFVFIDRKKETVNCSYVITDFVKGAFEIGKYLIRKGYKKWAYLQGPKGVSSSNEHHRGLYKSIDEVPNNGVKITNIHAGFAEDDGYRAAQKALASCKPDVIVAINDPVAIGAFRYLRKMKLQIPKDIALVGFSDLKSADLLAVPLTTVRESTTQIGKRALEILLEQVRNPDSVYCKLKLKPELIIRSST